MATNLYFVTHSANREIDSTDTNRDINSKSLFINNCHQKCLKLEKRQSLDLDASFMFVNHKRNMVRQNVFLRYFQ